MGLLQAKSRLWTHQAPRSPLQGQAPMGSCAEGSCRGLGPPLRGSNRVVDQAVHISAVGTTLSCSVLYTYLYSGPHNPASLPPPQPEGPLPQTASPRAALKGGSRSCIACIPGSVTLPGIRWVPHDCG